MKTFQIVHFTTSFQTHTLLKLFSQTLLLLERKCYYFHIEIAIFLRKAANYSNAQNSYFYVKIGL